MPLPSSWIGAWAFSRRTRSSYFAFVAANLSRWCPILVSWQFVGLRSIIYYGARRVPGVVAGWERLDVPATCDCPKPLPPQLTETVSLAGPGCMHVACWPADATQGDSLSEVMDFGQSLQQMCDALEGDTRECQALLKVGGSLAVRICVWLPWCSATSTTASASKHNHLVHRRESAGLTARRRCLAYLPTLTWQPVRYRIFWTRSIGFRWQTRSTAPYLVSWLTDHPTSPLAAPLVLVN